MGRLIDADMVKQHIAEVINKQKGKENDLIPVRELPLFIDNQPTAYDVDNVVEEFDKKYNNSLWIKGNEEFSITRNELIEIVKQGGVSDDVCEWEKGSSGYVGFPAFYSKCCTTDSNGLEMQSHIIADWKYCPYCGKKIKVV